MTAGDTFDAQFAALMGFKPFCWQRRLFDKHFLTGSLPPALDLPTGLGKTSVMAIWYLAVKAGARLPRRLVYVVDRRAVVDQATEEAEKIKAWAENADHGKLPISTLRGQYADKGDWLADPAVPAIIVGTVDMIGSRLLFEGYGVTRRMRPYHAGLMGADTLVVLDESHLVPPFERLLEHIADRDAFGPPEDQDGKVIPPFRLLPLSATGRDRDGAVFRLINEDREKDEAVGRRLAATKRLTFAPAEPNSLADRLTDEAWQRMNESASPARVLVYCNSREVAGKVHENLHKRAKDKAELELFVGARRVREREIAKKRLEKLGFFSGNAAPEKPAFVVATSAGEVGVDLDADHMVMDLAPFERMVQRLGRVNRLGDKDAKVVTLEAADPELPHDIKSRAERCPDLLRSLPRHEDGSHDASPGALAALKRGHEDAIDAAATPEPLYPALTRPLVDAWSMTSLKEHAGRPKVQRWLRGWVEDRPQTTLVWRSFLPVRMNDGRASERETAEMAREMADFFEAAPPHLTETLEVRTDRVHKWLLDRAKRLRIALDKSKADRNCAEEAEGSAPPSPNAQEVAAIVLGRAGEDAQVVTLDDLLEVSESDGGKKRQLERKIEDRMLVLDARMGGLRRNGLFDPKEDGVASTADADEAWERAVGFRVRSILATSEETDRQWHKAHLFDLCRGEDGDPLRQLRVEKYEGATATEDDRSLTFTRPQLLEQHQEWVACRARKLVEALKLDGSLGEAIVLAARLHDEGKKADVWQRAFSARADGIYAKTTGPFRRSTLGGYRHEFGSLVHVERNNAFGALSEDLQDLVLHLVAAHHGRARPVIETDGCEDVPSALNARARDVALRFARLQRRWGPWGLAWLEAILRAADQRASRDLDEGRVPHD